MRATQHGTSRLAVGLYRVSTGEQGQSGLGLEAQQASVRVFVAAQGWPLVAEFSDIASGKDDQRPGFQTALARCRQLGAVLVSARLNRITRRAHAVSPAGTGLRNPCRPPAQLPPALCAAV
jgi:DNA invertase Pin-like site-specific DNA recombinase